MPRIVRSSSTPRAASPDHNAPSIDKGEPGKRETHAHYATRWQLWRAPRPRPRACPLTARCRDAAQRKWAPFDPGREVVPESEFPGCFFVVNVRYATPHGEYAADARAPLGS
jgi:hypothetical protein